MCAFVFMINIDKCIRINNSPVNGMIFLLKHLYIIIESISESVKKYIHDDDTTGG